MKAVINRTGTGYQPEKAEAVAAELNAIDCEGWTYKVRHRS